MKKILASLLAAAVALGAAAEDQRAAYAYGLQAVPGADGSYTFSFKVTSPTVTGAKLVFNDGAGKSFDLAVPVADPAAQVDYVLPGFSEVAAAFGLSGEISWGVEISSTVPGTEPVQVLRNEGYRSADNGRCYGGVAVITDPEYDSFGTAMVFTESRNGVVPGIELIDPQLNVTTHFRDSEDAGFAAIGSQCIPFERRGRFVFNSWSDGGSGLYMYDPATPEVLPVQMFQGERDADGLFTNNGVAVGGSVPAACASVDGNSIYTFDEELPHPSATGVGHVFARYDLGDAWTIAEGPNWYSSSVVTYTAASGNQEASRPVNNSCNNFAVTPWGIMIGQARWSNGALYASYFFWNPENDMILREYNPTVCPDMVSSGGSVTMNKEYTLIARAGYTGNSGDITVHPVTWEEVEGGKVPAIGEVKWTCPANSAANVLRFDYAGNLYLYDGYISSTGCCSYTVYAFPGNYTVTTPCRSNNKLSTEAGLEGAVVENGASATYYDLSGRTVDASNLSAGIYVKLCNGKASKVVIR